VQRIVVVAIVIVVMALLALGVITDFLVDWAWFAALGYLPVLWRILGSKGLLFLAVYGGSTALLWVNGSLAYRFARPRGIVPRVDVELAAMDVQTLPELFALMRQRLPWRLVIAGIAGGVGILVAAGEVGNWDVLLRYVYQVPYGQSDPLYGKDIGFYLFSLPAYLALKNWLLLMLFLSVVVAGAVYWVNGGIELDGQRWSMSPAAIAHGSALLGLFFVVKAWSYGLDRYLLLYRDNGVVVGASYTDVQVALPVLWLLVGLAPVAALVSWANLWVRT